MIVLAYFIDIVAWYGAVVATAAIALSGFVAWRDSRRLKVVAKANMCVMGLEPDFEKDESIVIIEVANIGRRPIALKKLPYFQERWKKSGHVVVGGWRPTDRINEGESATMLCKQKGLPISKIRRVVVCDETGRRWKGKVVSGEKPTK